MQALTEACRADRSAAVRKSYAAAAALLCRHAPAARVNRFVGDALALLAADDASRDDRYVAGGPGLSAAALRILWYWLSGLRLLPCHGTALAICGTSLASSCCRNGANHAVLDMA